MLDFFNSEYLFLWVGNVVSACLFWYMHRCFFTPRAWTKTRNLIVFLVYSGDVVLTSFANSMENPAINMLSSISAFLIPIFICYNPKNVRGYIYFLFYHIGILLLELLLGLAFGFYKNFMGFQTHYDLINIQMIVIMNLGEILIVLIICRFGKKEENKRLNRIALSFMSIPVVSILMIMADQIKLCFGKMPDFNPEQFTWTAIIILSVNVLVFILLERYTKLLKRDMELIDKAHKLQADADIMSLAAKSMKERLDISNQMIQQDRVMRHDRRHFEATLLSLLQDGKVDLAISNLEERLAVEPKIIKKYCDNTTVNAAIGHYVAKAEEADIKVEMELSIPENLAINEMEFAITISNLLENAINGCKKLPEEERYIRFIVRYKKQLLLELSNSCNPLEIKMDENNYPVSEEKEHGVHGIGTRSVIAFVNKTGSEVDYSVENNEFRVRMMVNV